MIFRCTAYFWVVPKDRLLSYIKNFIFEDHNGTLIKKELNTTSFWVNFAVEAAKAIKLMVMVVLVIWHARKGKNISMAIYAGILEAYRLKTNDCRTGR
jgi:type I site-specific restriction-modification system R (restriction) subunit